MPGGKNKKLQGYTIIEVMVVLAVSGFMFLIAAQFTNGKQERAAFTSGINQMASNIQDVIEQVSDGSYTDVPLSCSINNGSTDPSANMNAAQGTNSGCVFLGKSIQLTVDSSNYLVYSYAGARLDGNNNPITSLYAADPVKLGQQFTISGAVPQSLKVDGIYLVNADGSTPSLQTSPNQNGVIAFFQSQGSGTTKAGNFILSSGAQTVSLYAATDANSFNSNMTGVGPFNGGEICLDDGTQYGAIVIGDSNSGLVASVKRGGNSHVCP